MQSPQKEYDTNYVFDDDQILLSVNSINLSVEDYDQLMDEKENIDRQLCSKIRDFKNPLFDDNVQPPTNTSNFPGLLSQDCSKKTMQQTYEKGSPNQNKYQSSNQQNLLEQKQPNQKKDNFGTKFQLRGVSEERQEELDVKNDAGSMDRLQGIKTSLQKLNNLSQYQHSQKQHSFHNQLFRQQQQNDVLQQHNIFDSDAKRYQDIVKKYKQKLQQSQYQPNQKKDIINTPKQKMESSFPQQSIYNNTDNSSSKLLQNGSSSNSQLKINNTGLIYSTQSSIVQKQQEQTLSKENSQQGGQEEGSDCCGSESQHQFSQLSDAVRELRESIKKHKQNGTILLKQFGSRDQHSPAIFKFKQQYRSDHFTTHHSQNNVQDDS